MVKVERSVRAVAAEWERLATRVGAPPFLGPTWFAAWLGAFGGVPELFVSRDEGGLRGVLPLIRRGGALTSPTNWHTPLFDATLADEDSAAKLCETAAEHAGRRLDLSFLDPGSPILAACQRFAEEDGWKAIRRTVLRSPYVPLDRSWADYQATIPARRRSKYRRFRRRLEEIGRVEVTVEDGTENLDALLDEAFRIEALGWKGKEGTAILSDPQVEAFYRQVAHAHAARGSLALWFLRLDGRPLAFALAIVEGGVHYDLKVGFDPAWGRYGPGVLLIEARLRHAFESGLRRFEFLGQAERHKTDWTGTIHERLRLQLFPPTPIGEASRIAWDYGRPLVRAALRQLDRARDRLRG